MNIIKELRCEWEHGKWRRCHQWYVFKRRLVGGKLGLCCVFPCLWIEWHRGEPSWFPLMYQGFGAYACPWILKSYVWGWNLVLCTLYGAVDGLWVVGACILLGKDSCLLCFLRVECLCIGTLHQLSPGGYWVKGVGHFQWGWENVLYFGRVMVGWHLAAGWNGWCRQRDGELEHHTKKQ